MVAWTMNDKQKMLIGELADCTRMAMLGDAGPLKRWKQLWERAEKEDLDTLRFASPEHLAQMPKAEP